MSFQDEDEGHEEIVEGEDVHVELAEPPALLPVVPDVVLKRVDKACNHKMRDRGRAFLTSTKNGETKIP